jgi:hypothetical protein
MGSIYGQNHNPTIQGKYAHMNKNDVVFTPDWLAKKICSLFPIKGRVYEPCKGEGVFLRYLPKDTLWSEITEGRNLYDFNEPVDWIVTNPPYSDFNRFLNHCFTLSENIVLLVPVAKMFKSIGTLNIIYTYGGIVSFYYLPASKAGFPFGFPCGVCYIKKGYTGLMEFKDLDLVKESTKQQSFSEAE